MQTNLNLLMNSSPSFLGDYIHNEEYSKIVNRLVDDNWAIERKTAYINVLSKMQKMARQGWKIHVSATIKNAGEILEKVTEICVQNNTSFKFMLDKQILMLSLGKNYPRESSGKFITIYPDDLDKFRSLMAKLYKVLKGYNGPYILSDRRFKDCKVLYYRYGGFIPLTKMNHDGSKSFMIKSPNNTLHIESRKPFFTIPSWETDPFKTNLNKDEDGDANLKSGRYTVESILSNNNSGGVYLANDNIENEKVVIKEARPYTLPLDGTTYDAISHKKKEYESFKLLSSKNITPLAIDSFYEWEHFFTVVSLVRGRKMREYLVEQTPFLNPELPKEDSHKFFDNLTIIWTNIVENLLTLHDNNIYLCDFSIDNFFVKEDLSIIFMDLDGSLSKGEYGKGLMFSRGYIDPEFINEGTYTLESELYGLGALFFSTLSTFNNFLEINTGFIDSFLMKLQKEIHLPDKFVVIIKSLMNHRSKKEINLNGVLNLLNNSTNEIFSYYSPITKWPSSDQEINDRINDINNFIISSTIKNEDLHMESKKHNHINVYNGVAGEMYNLKKTHGSVPIKYVNWMKHQKLSQESYPPSLYLGLSGIAWTFYLLDETDYAQHIMDNLVNPHALRYSSPDIYTGVAGIGLTNLFFWQQTKKQCFLDEAILLSDHLLDIAHVNGGKMSWPSPEGITYLGYAKGASGIAIFLLYVYKISGNKKYLTGAKKAIDHDLSYAIVKEDFISFPNTTQNTSTFSPYWFSGSAGIAASLMRYKYITKDHEYDDLLKMIINDSNRVYTLFPGLLNGLTGLGNLFLDAEQFLGDPSYFDKALDLADSINMFAMKKNGGIAFPGDYLNKISNDFGTGSSGVNLFLNRLVQRDNNFMFFIDELLFE